ncbi:MAG: LysR substrate-binding domain-containing protein [Hyphomicrobiaceae bacterium]
MRRDLDLTILRAFLAVVETGSVTGAARLLNRTQAAVSLQIKRLEDTLAQPLFERGHKRLTLAPAGEQLIGFAQRLVAMNDEVVETMTTPSFEGEVRLGLPVDLIVTYAAPILRRFNEKWPGVRVSLVASNSQELVEGLEGGRVDLALTTDLETGGRHVETMVQDDLVWVGSPGGGAHRRSPLPVAIGGRSCRFRPVLLDALRRADVDWRVVLEVANQDAVNATVAAGISVAAMLRETVPPSLDVLTAEAGLPELPSFALNLRMPPAGANELAEEMARHIRAEFATRAALRGDRLFDGGGGDRRGRRARRAAA